MEPWRVAGRSVPCGFGYTSLAPVCWAEPLTWSALPRSLWRSREEHERDWLGCGLGAQPPSRGPSACWEEAEQVTGVQSRSRAAARPGGWTALLKPALTPERLTGQGGSLSASQLYPRLSAPQLIRRSLAMGLPSDSSIFSPQAPLPPSLPTIWLPTLHTLDMPLPCPPPSRDPIA